MFQAVFSPFVARSDGARRLPTTLPLLQQGHAANHRTALRSIVIPNIANSNHREFTSPLKARERSPYWMLVPCLSSFLTTPRDTLQEPLVDEERRSSTSAAEEQEWRLLIDSTIRRRPQLSHRQSCFRSPARYRFRSPRRFVRLLLLLPRCRRRWLSMPAARTRLGSSIRGGKRSTRYATAVRAKAPKRCSLIF